jgi:predicted XRE-type DNA-binding protein
MLANSNGAPAAAVTHLNRNEIHVAEEGVFQWRRYQRNARQSADHITALVRGLKATGEPFEAILVFWAGDRFFAVDGHHRLAAYDAANWNAPIPVKVCEGSSDAAQLAALQGNNKDKLPMTRADKSNAAWRLVKQGGFSQSQIAALTAVSTSTVKNMRRKLHEIEAAGADPLEMDWERAQRWPGDGYLLCDKPPLRPYYGPWVALGVLQERLGPHRTRGGPRDPIDLGAYLPDGPRGGLAR